MAQSENYFPDKFTVFRQIKVYIGLKDELTRIFHYYMYKCYGKHWKKGERYDSIDFLLQSVKHAQNTNINLVRDIKENKELYRGAINELLHLINDAGPYKTDEYSLTMVISFHRDIDLVLKTVLRSKKTFKY